MATATHAYEDSLFERLFKNLQQNKGFLEALIETLLRQIPRRKHRNHIPIPIGKEYNPEIANILDSRYGSEYGDVWRRIGEDNNPNRLSQMVYDLAKRRIGIKEVLDRVITYERRLGSGGQVKINDAVTKAYLSYRLNQ